MKILVIEDEKPAAEKLVRAISSFNPSMTVTGVCTTVKESIAWLQNNDRPDLMFMDIELSDGLSFAIFDHVEITVPVVFCTAFDDYWQQAFEYNSIDYLLKPVKQEKLNGAIKKYEKLSQHFTPNILHLKQQHESLDIAGIKKRFLVKRGGDYISIKSEDISFFYATHKLVCLVDNRNQKFILDQSLSDIEKQVDPAKFYRVTRKYLVNQDAIKKISTHLRSKLLVELSPSTSDQIIISQENTANFKEWMSQ